MLFKGKEYEVMLFGVNNKLSLNPNFIGTWDFTFTINKNMTPAYKEKIKAVDLNVWSNR